MRLPQYKYSIKVINYFLDSSQLDQLKMELFNTAILISGEKSDLAINKDVQTVELQISKRGCRRFVESDYFKRKQDPELWNQTLHGDIKLKDLFPQAQERAKTDAQYATSNDASKKKYIGTHGNCVAISGQAGIGKTTLTKQLVEKVINKKLLDIDFLFYVSLNKVNYSQKMSVLQFLLTNLDSSWEHDPSSDKEILKRLEESEKVMIILDGLDEATLELEKQCLNAKLYDVQTPEMLLKNILNGNILRKAKKLITSRPRQMLELHQQYRPHFMVDILGINLEAQRRICQDICGADSQKVLNELINHPELLAQCYVPIICIFTIYYLHQRLVDADQTVSFASVTNIILNVLETFARLGISKSEFELKKLSRLAWEGLRRKKYEFSEKEIEHSGLKKESLNTVLTTGTKANTRLRLLHVEKITYFSHLILQEFFSAVWLILFLPFNDFKNVLCDKQFENLDVVKVFIFGLCNATTYRHLIHLPSSLVPNKANFVRKKLLLKQFGCKIAEDLSSRNFPKYLEVCSLLYEMQDQELTIKVVERFSKELQISPNDKIFPHDVVTLCDVLQYRQSLLELMIIASMDCFVGDSFERFMSKISGMPDSVIVSMVEFNCNAR